jgi:hypothetical protein
VDIIEALLEMKKFGNTASLKSACEFGELAFEAPELNRDNVATRSLRGIHFGMLYEKRERGGTIDKPPVLEAKQSHYERS